MNRTNLEPAATAAVSAFNLYNAKKVSIDSYVAELTYINATNTWENRAIDNFSHLRGTVAKYAHVQFIGKVGAVTRVAYPFIEFL